MHVSDGPYVDPIGGIDNTESRCAIPYVIVIKVVGAPGFEPGTSCSQSLAQGGPFPDKISIYAGFVRISEARDSVDTDPIRNSTYPVTYPPPSAAWSW